MKNKIMKSLVIVTAIIFALFFTREANASTEIAGGGEFYNGEETTINLDFDHRTTLGKWQYVIESDFYYQLEDDIEDENNLYTQFKLNRELNDKTYALVVLQVDYDKMRDYDFRNVLGLGYGRKLYVSDKWKVSNESSLAIKEGGKTETIFRNSLWVAYNPTPYLTITNKALIESSEQRYMRIETEIEYALTKSFAISLANEYSEDYESENILTFNFKLKLNQG
jgi:putative salt-induced outer membrane protein YdiY